MSPTPNSLRTIARRERTSSLRSYASSPNRNIPLAPLSEIEVFSHDHVYLGSSHDENARRTLWVVALTAVMMVGEIIAGYLTGSMALLADGFHMATHAGALGVAAVAYAYAKRHASNRAYSFGTGKVGDLAGFASAMVLGLVALAIGIESVLDRKSTRLNSSH